MASSRPLLTQSIPPALDLPPGLALGRQLDQIGGGDIESSATDSLPTLIWVGRARDAQAGGLESNPEMTRLVVASTVAVGRGNKKALTRTLNDRAVLSRDLPRGKLGVMSLNESRLRLPAHLASVPRVLCSYPSACFCSIPTFTRQISRSARRPIASNVGSISSFTLGLLDPTDSRKIRTFVNPCKPRHGRQSHLPDTTLSS